MTTQLRKIESQEIGELNSNELDVVTGGAAAGAGHRLVDGDGNILRHDWFPLEQKSPFR